MYEFRVLNPTLAALPLALSESKLSTHLSCEFSVGKKLNKLLSYSENSYGDRVTRSKFCKYGSRKLFNCRIHPIWKISEKKNHRFQLDFKMTKATGILISCRLIICRIHYSIVILRNKIVMTNNKLSHILQSIFKCHHC